MKRNDSSTSLIETALELPAAQLKGLRLLQNAARAARKARRDRWDFAVGMRDLSTTGLLPSDLCELVSRGYMDSAEGARRRRSKDLQLTERSRFVLTRTGESVLRYEPTHDAVLAPADLELSATTHPRTLLPCWHRTRRTLYWGQLPVKQFVRPAPNQERILEAFEEDGWPEHVDDPLSCQFQRDPKERLHDTIKCLNRHQLHPLLWFRGDGTGEGVCWQVLSEQEA